MPIEIRELVIKARVEDSNQPHSGTSGGTKPSRGLSDEDLERIIAQCIDKVMAAIRQQKER